jgi:hypothetical protein
MKKMTATALSLVTASSLMAADSIESMFKEGKVSGQVRAFSISRAMENSYTRKANAIGGHLKYETGTLNGFSLGSAFYTTNGFSLRDDKTDYTKVDPTLLGDDNDAYSILGEAYLQYKTGNTTFKAGRQKLNTPLAGADDARMLPNLFEAYVLTNTDVKDTTLVAAHVTKFAQGTFGRAYTSGAVSVTAGYSLTDSKTRVGEFVNMGEYAIGDNTSGVTVGGIIYTGIEGVKLQAWDYYAHDILNAIYLQADASTKLSNGVTLYGAAQYIDESDVGNNSVTVLDTIDSQYYALKAGVKVNNINAYIAFSSTDTNDDAAIDGGIITPWGGMPAFTQGMVTRHQFLAGTDAWKVAGSYSWKDHGINLKTVLYHAQFDMDKKNNYSTDYAWKAKETGFDVIYYPKAVKNLQLRLRANYADDFKQTTTASTSWDEYRFIINYNF